MTTPHVLGQLRAGGRKRTQLLLAAFELGRKHAQRINGEGPRSIAQPPYNDPERAQAWEWGWRFQRELIERQKAEGR